MSDKNAAWNSVDQLRRAAYSGYGRGPAIRPRAAGASAADSPYMEALVRNSFPRDRNAVILDLGCGFGDLLHIARDAGYTRLTGVDQTLDPAAAALAAERRIELVAADLLSYLAAQSGASADVVVTFDVLEHFQRDEAIHVSQQVHRVLRPGGQWLVHVPNAQSLLFGRIRYGDLTHETAFTTQSLGQLLRLGGFTTVRFLEDAPVVHGIRSFGRLLAWKAIRLALRAYLAVETGRTGGAEIFTQGMLAVATRESD